MNQDEIDELLGSSSDEDKAYKNKNKVNKQKAHKKQSQKQGLNEDDEYDSDFWDEDNNETKQKEQNKYDDDEFEIQEIQGQQAVKSETQIDENEIGEESKHTSELHDEVEQSWDNYQNRQKDDDLSLAKSEYEESVRVNQNKSGQKDDKRKVIGADASKKLNNDVKKSGVNNKINGKQVSDKKKSQKQISSMKNESVNGENSNKKKKRSEQEIRQALQKINIEKKELEDKKKKKKEKEEKEKREIYEQAMRKENEKKQKKKQEDERKRKVLENKRKQKEEENKSQNGSTFKSRRNLAEQVQNETKDWKETKEKTKKELQEKRKESLQKKRKEQKEKQKMLDQRHLANLESLKQKKAEETKNAGIKKKEEFLKVKSNLDRAKIKEKEIEGKQQEVLMIKKIKNEIRDLKDENQQKTNKIHEFEKQIEKLKLLFKEKQKQLYTGFKKDSQKQKKNRKEHFVRQQKASDMAPIQKFVSQFVNFDSPQQIFLYLDESGDGVLTLDQIMKGIKREGVPDKIAQEIQKVLDRDSDGNITLEQFVFNIEAELKKQKNFRDFMGKIDIIDPLDIQAGIIDMRVKIKYMNNEISKLGDESEKVYEQKYQEYLKKIKKIEQISKKQKPSQGDGVHEDIIAENTKSMLKKECISLSNKIQMETKLLKAIKESLDKNLAEKNKTLMARVEENLLMKEKLYQMKNEIQQTQLRYLSLKKIQQNKQGYIERMSNERAEREQIYLKAKQYQLRIADPTKEVQNKKYAEDVRFLAAVIMIQRNYRKKKALREVQLKKNSK